MKITIELPDSTIAAFVNYVCNEEKLYMVSKGIDKKDIQAGYKDLREYEVSENKS